MDPTLKSALAGLFLLLVIISGIIFTQSLPGSHQDGITPVPTRTATTPTVHPIPTGSSQTVLPTLTVPATPDTVHARIDTVDTSQLALGKTSYAYVTLTNTGTIPITKTRIEITAGRDFRFPIGYQSRFFVQELYDRIEPGDTRILRDEFNLPLYEGLIPLEGLYEVTVKVYSNDWYYIGEWKGEVYLRG